MADAMEVDICVVDAAHLEEEMMDIDENSDAYVLAAEAAGLEARPAFPPVNAADLMVRVCVCVCMCVCALTLCGLES